jgi:hypothetical protein
LQAEAPIDGFGIGTRLDISVDAHPWTVSINCKNMPANPDANAPNTKRIGRGASKCTGVG